MADTPLKKVIIDVVTGTTTEVDLTPEEIAEIEAAAAERAALDAAQAAEDAAREALKASAKAKLVAGEALTEEEADILLQ